MKKQQQPDQSKLVAAETQGMTSEVYTQGKEQLLGHVLFCDFDKTSTDVILEQIAKLDGITFLLQSSTGCFHAINLVIRTLDETALLKLSLKGDDPNHAKVGYRRRRWVLRYTEKKRPDGYTIKKKPQVIKIFYNGIDKNVQRCSRPHRRIIEAMFDVDIGDRQLDYVFAGDTTAIEQYFTYHEV